MAILGSLVLGQAILGSVTDLGGGSSADIYGDAGIASSEAFGSGGKAQTDKIIGATGIESGEAFGASGGLVAARISGATGIPSGELFGSGGALAITGISGIPSGEAFTAGNVAHIASTSGVPSGEAFGAGGDIGGQITGPAGIASGEAFGTGGDGVMHWLLGATGIASSEAFGSGGTLGLAVSGAFGGIASSEAFGGSGVVISEVDPSRSQFRIYIDGVDMSRYVRAGSLSGSDQVNGRATLSFTWIDEAGVDRPEIGHEVIVFWQNPDTLITQRIFGGSVEDWEETVLTSTTCIEVSVNCVGYSAALDDRLVTGEFVGYTCESMLAYLQSAIFTDEDVTWVADGTPTTIGAMPDKKYDGAKATSILDELRQAAGREWRVDAYRNLFFGEYPASPTNAPVSFTDATNNWKKMRVHRERGPYRNVQGLRLNGIEQQPIVAEDHTVPGGGDAIGRYSAGQLLTQKPIVLLNNVAQRVTERGVYTAPWDVYWDSSGIQFNPDRLPLAAAATVSVRYQGIGTVRYTVNTSEVSARQAVEGFGSGRKEAINAFGGRANTNISGIVATLEARLGAIVDSASIETDYFGIQAGQKVTLNCTQPLVSGDFLVESVSWQEISGKQRISSTLKVVKGGTKGTGWNSPGSSFGGGSYGGGGGSETWNGGGTESYVPKPETHAMRYVFNIAPSTPGCDNAGIIAGAMSIPPQIIVQNGVVANVLAYMGTHEGNQDAIFDIKRNGVSIFHAQGKPTFAPRPPEENPSYAVEKFFNFASNPSVVHAGDLITVSTVQVGSDAVSPTGAELGHDVCIVLVIEV